MASLVRECGSVIWSWRPRQPLRMRVSRSAIGSVIMIALLLPARLDEAGNQSLQREIAHADAAKLEAPVDAARAAALLAACVSAHRELRLALALDDHRLLGHLPVSPSYFCDPARSRNGMPSCVSSARP